MLPFPLFALCGVCRCSDGSSIEMRSLELFGAELWSDREFLFGSRWNIEHRIHHYVSTIERRPRAPSLNSIALSTI